MLTDREELLVAKALEGLLTPVEEQELQAILEERPEVRTEMQSLQSVKEVTMELQFKKPPEEMWARYWVGVYARLERGIAWLLISVGGAILLAVAGYHALLALLEDTTMPLVVKLGLVVLALGGAILLVSVLREKWFLRKTDKYREVVR